MGSAIHHLYTRNPFKQILFASEAHFCSGHTFCSRQFQTTWQWLSLYVTLGSLHTGRDQIALEPRTTVWRGAANEGGDGGMSASLGETARVSGFTRGEMLVLRPTQLEITRRNFYFAKWKNFTIRVQIWNPFSDMSLLIFLERFEVGDFKLLRDLLSK